MFVIMQSPLLSRGVASSSRDPPSRATVIRSWVTTVLFVGSCVAIMFAGTIRQTATPTQAPSLHNFPKPASIMYLAKQSFYSSPSSGGASSPYSSYASAYYGGAGGANSNAGAGSELLQYVSQTPYTASLLVNGVNYQVALDSRSSKLLLAEPRSSCPSTSSKKSNGGAASAQAVAASDASAVASRCSRKVKGVVLGEQWRGTECRADTVAFASPVNASSHTAEGNEGYTTVESRAGIDFAFVSEEDANRIFPCSGPADGLAGLAPLAATASSSSSSSASHTRGFFSNFFAEASSSQLKRHVIGLQLCGHGSVSLSSPSSYSSSGYGASASAAPAMPLHGALDVGGVDRSHFTPYSKGPAIRFASMVSSVSAPRGAPASCSGAAALLQRAARQGLAVQVVDVRVGDTSVLHPGTVAASSSSSKKSSATAGSKPAASSNPASSFWPGAGAGAGGASAGGMPDWHSFMGGAGAAGGAAGGAPAGGAPDWSSFMSGAGGSYGGSSTPPSPSPSGPAHGTATSREAACAGSLPTIGLVDIAEPSLRFPQPVLNRIVAAVRQQIGDTFPSEKVPTPFWAGNMCNPMGHYGSMAIEWPDITLLLRTAASPSTPVEITIPGAAYVPDAKAGQCKQGVGSRFALASTTTKTQGAGKGNAGAGPGGAYGAGFDWQVYAAAAGGSSGASAGGSEDDDADASNDAQTIAEHHVIVLGQPLVESFYTVVDYDRKAIDQLIEREAVNAEAKKKAAASAAAAAAAAAKSKGKNKSKGKTRAAAPPATLPVPSSVGWVGFAPVAGCPDPKHTSGSSTSSKKKAAASASSNKLKTAQGEGFRDKFEKSVSTHVPASSTDKAPASSPWSSFTGSGAAAGGTGSSPLFVEATPAPTATAPAPAASPATMVLAESAPDVKAVQKQLAEKLAEVLNKSRTQVETTRARVATKIETAKADAQVKAPPAHKAAKDEINTLATQAHEAIATHADQATADLNKIAADLQVAIETLPAHADKVKQAVDAKVAEIAAKIQAEHDAKHIANAGASGPAHARVASPAAASSAVPVLAVSAASTGGGFDVAKIQAKIDSAMLKVRERLNAAADKVADGMDHAMVKLERKHKGLVKDARKMKKDRDASKADVNKANAKVDASEKAMEYLSNAQTTASSFMDNAADSLPTGASVLSGASSSSAASASSGAKGSGSYAVPKFIVLMEQNLANLQDNDDDDVVAAAAGVNPVTGEPLSRAAIKLQAKLDRGLEVVTHGLNSARSRIHANITSSIKSVEDREDAAKDGPTPATKYSKATLKSARSAMNGILGTAQDAMTVVFGAAREAAAAIPENKNKDQIKVSSASPALIQTAAAAPAPAPAPAHPTAKASAAIDDAEVAALARLQHSKKVADSALVRARERVAERMHAALNNVKAYEAKHGKSNRTEVAKETIHQTHDVSDAALASAQIVVQSTFDAALGVAEMALDLAGSAVDAAGAQYQKTAAYELDKNGIDKGKKNGVATDVKKASPTLVVLAKISKKQASLLDANINAALDALDASLAATTASLEQADATAAAGFDKAMDAIAAQADAAAKNPYMGTFASDNMKATKSFMKGLKSQVHDAMVASSSNIDSAFAMAHNSVKTYAISMTSGSVAGSGISPIYAAGAGSATATATATASGVVAPGVAAKDSLAFAHSEVLSSLKQSRQNAKAMLGEAVRTVKTKEAEMGRSKTTVRAKRVINDASKSVSTAFDGAFAIVDAMFATAKDASAAIATTIPAGVTVPKPNLSSASSSSSASLVQLRASNLLVSLQEARASTMDALDAVPVANVQGDALAGGSHGSWLSLAGGVGMVVVALFVAGKKISEKDGSLLSS